ncbi:MAG: biotin transporter BioY [Lachnospiraceae bacterium]|nr:biotin transporter BioY [Lachnospiraceae bacterium]
MNKTNTQMITTTALMAAVLCVLGPLSLPIGPVPIALANLALYFMVYIVGTKISVIACAIYLLLGLVGLPVFSGYAGGPQKLFGPTGGYLIGYIPMILIMGFYVTKHAEKRVQCILVMEAATWVLYLMGTLWLAHAAGMSFYAALGAGVLPFILLDLAKICAAAIFAPMIRERLVKANVMEVS